MNFPKMNLHCHTDFSDGRHTIKQMVNKAVKYKLDYLAITDHFTNSWKASIIPTLNSIDKISEYLNKISISKKFIRNNNLQLRVFKGIEIDIGSSENFIKKLIQPQKFEIILFEYLETLEGIAFIRNLIDYWKRKIPSKNFPLLGLAHLDPSYFIYNGLNRLIQLLKNNDIYFEFNSSYSHFYSRKNKFFFEKLKEHQIPVGIGSDAHYSKEIALIEEPLSKIRDYGLENNLTRLVRLLKKGID